MQPIIHHLDVMRSKGLFKTASADTVMMDMPYRFQYGDAKGASEDEKYKAMAKLLAEEAFRVLKDGGNLVIVNTTRLCYMIHPIFEAAGFTYRTEAVCRKTNYIIRKDALAIDNDKILFFYKGTSDNWWNPDYGRLSKKYKLDENNQFPTTWSDIPNHNGYTHRQGGITHPEAMNEAVAERAIMLSTRPGQRMVEFFVGAGTGVVVCAKYGIDYEGVEGQAKYVSLAWERYRDFVDKTGRYEVGKKYAKPDLRLLGKDGMALLAEVKPCTFPKGQLPDWSLFVDAAKPQLNRITEATTSASRIAVRVASNMGFLPDTERMIVKSLLAGKGQKQIASMLGITQGAVSSRLHRAQRRVEFVESLPALSDNDWQALGRCFESDVVEIARGMMTTTCQSEVASMMCAKHPGTHHTQVTVRYRWTQMLDLLKRSDRPELAKIKKALLLVGENGYMLHEVKLPYFEKSKEANRAKCAKV